jgi:hypothetical protein
MPNAMAVGGEPKASHKGVAAVAPASWTRIYAGGHRSNASSRRPSEACFRALPEALGRRPSEVSYPSSKNRTEASIYVPRKFKSHI